MSSGFAGGFTLVVSAVLLLFAAVLLARALGRTRAERFWIAVAASALQLGALAMSLSLFHAVRPGTWLLVQALLSAATAGAIRSGRLRLQASAAAKEPESTRLGILGWLFVAAVLLLAALSLAEQKVTPVSGFDDRMYHASRAAYWQQNASLLPYTTHNDRQVALPFGSDLVFFWGLLMGGSEAAGRLAFWAGYPLALLGLLFLLRQAGASPRTAWAGVLLFAATPGVATAAVGLNPEPWCVVFVLGLAWALLRARQSDVPDEVGSALAGLFLALAANVRTTSVVLVVGAALLLVRPATHLRRRAACAAGGALVGFLLSGLAVTTLGNLIREGHPLGSAAFRRVHASDLSSHQLVAHTARLAALFAEVPDIPSAELRATLESEGRRLLERAGATRLPGERAESWPGLYAFHVPERAANFSLGGLVWLPSLLVALVLACRAWARGRPLGATASLSILQAPLLLTVALLLRWMPLARVPERFLVSPYALGVALVTLGAGRLLASHSGAPRSRLVLGRAAAGISIVLIAWMTFDAASEQLSRVRLVLARPVPTTVLDEPYERALLRLPLGSRILLVGGQATRDYPLFAPREGFRNVVLPWGKARFRADEMRRRLEEGRVTHVLVENDQEVDRHWEPALPTREMVSWLENAPGLEEIPLLTKGMRLFEVTEARRSLGLPRLGSRCSFTLDEGWMGLEKGDGDWWQWSAGTGEIRALSDHAGPVLLSFQLYSMARPENRVAVLVDGRQEAEVVVRWDNFDVVRPFPVYLKRGETSIRMVSALPAVVAARDGRKLAFAVKNLTLSGDVPCEYEP